MSAVLLLVLLAAIVTAVVLVRKRKRVVPEDEPVILPPRKAEPARHAPTGGTAPVQAAAVTEPKSATPVAEPSPVASNEPVSTEAPAPEIPTFEESSSPDAAPLLTIAPEIASPPPPPVRHASGRPSAELGRVDLLSLRRGLAKTRASEGFFGRLKALLTGRTQIAPEIAEEIEELLLTSDVGVQTTERILGSIKDRLRRGELSSEPKVWDALREEACRILDIEGPKGALTNHSQPTVVLFVGVNGAGKTTTIGKLAKKLRAQGKTVMLAAGDTFRAAAVEQLRAWGERTGSVVVSGKDGADPSSVLFDAVQQARSQGVDFLLADTAGRLHTKANLMQEMSKIERTAAKALDGAPHEVFLVLDATNGQNALAQAREFKEAVHLTGLVLTKLDGTAKGGIVLGICDQLAVPVRYVGVGERPEDLQEFGAAEFVEALLGNDSEGVAA
jgi:fused signal recognition particle receptor